MLMAVAQGAAERWLYAKLSAHPSSLRHGCWPTFPNEQLSGPLQLDLSRIVSALKETTFRGITKSCRYL